MRPISAQSSAIPRKVCRLLVWYPRYSVAGTADTIVNAILGGAFPLCQSALTIVFPIRAGLEGLGGATVNLESTLRIESTSGR